MMAGKVPDLPLFFIILKLSSWPRNTGNHPEMSSKRDEILETTLKYHETTTKCPRSGRKYSKPQQKVLETGRNTRNQHTTSSKREEILETTLRFMKYTVSLYSSPKPDLRYAPLSPPTCRKLSPRPCRRPWSALTDSFFDLSCRPTTHQVRSPLRT
jgi:hypothetical protein